MTKARWNELKLSEPRKTCYEFYATGRGTFPFDMLRHDCCWPASTEDAMELVWEDPALCSEHRSIRFRSYRKPEPDRWSSFGWPIGTEKLS